MDYATKCLLVYLHNYECSCWEFGMTDPSSPTDEQVVFVLAPKKEYVKNSSGSGGAKRG